MTTLGEVVARIRSVLERLPSGALQEAHARLVDRLIPALEELTKGTASQDLVTAQATLRAVSLRLKRAEQLLESAQASTGEWLAEHGEAAPEPPSPRTGSAAPPERASDLAKRVSGYRTKLDHPWPYGKPLRGWRLSTQEGGDTELSSGTRLASGQTDPAYTAAVERATTLGLARGGFVPDIARHIEVKEASTMSTGETRTIVIGKDPCGIDPVTNVSCHRFLRHFLPPDATLIIYGPTGPPYRYEGKRTS
ncbi:DddA-like double-stranded DNA deaminase toxin [Saccharomonospora iraqiensis]|uniref:DddA-like double-stranded DNA deaminase toxin n=1 Tax=Saccharomonospora iraqiensis TaxID=52698 RepID=UPI0012B5D160|nr:DddA-like double-stranded DNA deaminase toxin [Saccharomonospora iraqiensis]